MRLFQLGRQAALAEAWLFLFHDSHLREAVVAAAAGTSGALRGASNRSRMGQCSASRSCSVPNPERAERGNSVRIIECTELGELDVGSMRTPFMTPAQAILTPLLSESFASSDGEWRHERSRSSEPKFVLRAWRTHCRAKTSMHSKEATLTSS